MRKLVLVLALPAVALARRRETLAVSRGALLLLLLLLPAAPAAAATPVDRASVHLALGHDGAVHVTERLTFGAGAGGVPDERFVDRTQGFAGPLVVDRVAVRDGGGAFARGSAKAAATGTPCASGRLSVQTTREATRIAWCRGAARRTVVLSFRLRRAVTRRADGLLLGLVVWPSRWPVPVGGLHATLTVPASRSGLSTLADTSVQTSGVPRASVRIGAASVRLRSGPRGPGQALSLAALLPADALPAHAREVRTAGLLGGTVLRRVADGGGLTADGADGSLAEAAAVLPGTPRSFLERLPAIPSQGHVVAVGAGLLVLLFAFLFWRGVSGRGLRLPGLALGRRRGGAYDRR